MKRSPLKPRQTRWISAMMALSALTALSACKPELISGKRAGSVLSNQTVSGATYRAIRTSNSGATCHGIEVPNFIGGPAVTVTWFSSEIQIRITADRLTDEVTEVVNYFSNAQCSGQSTKSVVARQGQFRYADERRGEFSAQFSQTANASSPNFTQGTVLPGGQTFVLQSEPAYTWEIY